MIEISENCYVSLSRDPKIQASNRLLEIRNNPARSHYSLLSQTHSRWLAECSVFLLYKSPKEYPNHVRKRSRSGQATDVYYYSFLWRSNPEMSICAASAAANVVDPISKSAQTHTHPVTTHIERNICWIFSPRNGSKKLTCNAYYWQLGKRVRNIQDDETKVQTEVRYVISN